MRPSGKPWTALILLIITMAAGRRDWRTTGNQSQSDAGEPGVDLRSRILSAEAVLGHAGIGLVLALLKAA